jgi:hypothetical protein
VLVVSESLRQVRPVTAAEGVWGLECAPNQWKLIALKLLFFMASVGGRFENNVTSGRWMVAIGNIYSLWGWR